MPTLADPPPQTASAVVAAPAGAPPSGDGEAAMIEARGLSKFYGPFAAVRDVSFAVPRGQVCAFLGPNGAGKSTTMRMLTGFLAPSAGSASVAGHDVADDRLAAAAGLGYLPENGPLYQEMSPSAFLNYVGGARGMASADLKRRREFVREACSLGSVWGKPIGKLSRGYRQRVGMAQALLHDPDVLILDEPTRGIDVGAKYEIYGLVNRLAEAGKAVIVISSEMPELLGLCDRIHVMNEGRFVGELDAAEATQEKVMAMIVDDRPTAAHARPVAGALDGDAAGRAA